MTMSILAQTATSDGPPKEFLAAFGMAMLGFICCAVVVGLLIQALICYFTSKILEAVPPEHRKQQPGMVWLLMIPLFNLIWNFFVFPKVSESLKSYYTSIGRTDVGDCQGGLAMAYCILAACAIIPYLGALAGLAGLVVLIIFLIKANDLKKQISQPM